jgi:hypothetical protein
MMIRRSLAVIITILLTTHSGSSPPTEARNLFDQGQVKAAAPAPRDSAGGAITGLVLDDNHQPVAGAQIIIDNLSAPMTMGGSKHLG